MDYELATELKEAGFPQFWSDRHWFYNGRTSPPTLWCINALEHSERISHRADEEATNFVACPTLTELIEACGERSNSLGGDVRSNEWWAAERPEGLFVDTFPKRCTGATPEEAVARLWLALNKK